MSANHRRGLAHEEGTTGSGAAFHLHHPSQLPWANATLEDKCAIMQALFQAPTSKLDLAAWADLHDVLARLVAADETPGSTVQELHSHEGLP